MIGENRYTLKAKGLDRTSCKWLIKYGLGYGFGTGPGQKYRLFRG